jgi:hypothetical protein
MKVNTEWRNLGWRHPIGDMLRFYSVVLAQGRNIAADWRRKLIEQCTLVIDATHNLPIGSDEAALFDKYLDSQQADLQAASARLREEAEAVAYAVKLGATVRQVATKNRSHHQSQAAMIATVSSIATSVCRAKGVGYNIAPVRRCVWLTNNQLHVTARNLDGAVPALLFPTVIWEVKEYWGKTMGGSKMSDAVYECQLVGRELREFEERAGIRVTHVVFLDGKIQWGYRQSDLRRFVDLFHQGIIDHLLIGKDVKTEWLPLLSGLL